MLKAVIIDSNAMTRGLLQTILANNGWEVVGHTNTNAKGLLLLHKFQPHFVCIDLHQLDEDDAILEEIKENWPKTLIFLMSGEVNAATIQSVLARGVHGFFVKPFNQATVAATIRNAVLRLVKQQQAKADSN
jgi:two-component system chemotaxis response regulator CheY